MRNPDCWHWYVVGLPELGSGRRGWACVAPDADPPSPAWVAAELTALEQRQSVNAFIGRMLDGGAVLHA